MADHAIVIAGHVLVYLKGIILMPIVIKTIGVTVYGGFVLLSSILGLVFGLSSLGAGFRATRLLPSTESMQTRRELYYPQFSFHLFCIVLLSAALMLLHKPIGTYIFANEIAYSPLVIPAYLIAYFLFSQGASYLRYTSRVHYLTAATVSFPYLDIGFLLVFFACCHFIDINVLVLSQALSAFLIAVVCFGIVFREIGVGFSFYSRESLVADIKLGFPLILNLVVDFILAGSDRYLIALYLTVTDVGYYTPGYVLGSLIVFIPKAMGTALPQLMAKAVDSGCEYEAQRMLNYAVRIFLLLAIPFIFGSAVLERPILSLLANRDVAENARYVTPIVAAGTLFYGLNLILSNVLFVRMKTYAVFQMNLAAALFNLVANLVLLYFFRSILVAAVTTWASYLLAFGYIARVVKRETLQIDWQPGVVLKAVAAALVMYALLSWISAHAGSNASLAGVVVGELVLGIVVYVGMLLVLRTFTDKEMRFLKGCLCG